MVDEKVWCPRCEEERWTVPTIAGVTCIKCLYFIPGEDVILAEQEADDEEG